MNDKRENSPSAQTLRRLAAERILVLDGAMGTMIQGLELDEEGYRGARFDAWNREVRGNNDLLILSQPDAIRDIHLAYFRAGADIVSTNTFSSTRIAQADYGMQGIAHELNVEAEDLPARRPDLARAQGCAARVSSPARSGRPIRTASISPDVSIPLPRRHLRRIAQRLCRAGRRTARWRRRPTLIETIFDTLNAKAAIAAIADVTDPRGVCAPVIIPAPSPIAARMVAVGPDPRRSGLGEPCRAVLDRAQLCARRKEVRAHIARSPALPTLSCAPYPNAAFRTSSARYDESFGIHRPGLLAEFAKAGLVVLSSRLLRHHARPYPCHRAAVEGKAPRKIPELPPLLRLSASKPSRSPRKFRSSTLASALNVTARPASAARHCRRLCGALAIARIRWRTARRSST